LDFTFFWKVVTGFGFLEYVKRRGITLAVVTEQQQLVDGSR